VELPDWVVDEVLAPAKPIAFRLTVMLYRHGRPVAGRQGERRVYWRGTLAELSRLIGASKPHLIEAERYLAGVGFLRVHERTHNQAPHAISAPLDRPEAGNKLLPALEAKNTPHGGGDPDPSLSQREEEITTTTTAAREIICDRLAELGCTTPDAWIARFGPARCEAALALCGTFDGIRNPAGLVFTLLTSGQPLRAPPVPAEDDFEARKRKYTTGAWSGVARYR
jgi:hypothetical protein